MRKETSYYTSEILTVLTTKSTEVPENSRFA